MPSESTFLNSQPFDVAPEEAGDKDRRAVRMVRSFVDKSKRYRETHADLAIRSREKYTNWEVEELNRVRRANLKPSYGFTIIETLTPQLVASILGDNYVIKFKGRTPNDYPYEEVLTDFVDIQLSEMSFASKLPSYVKNMLLDGTAFAKVPYRYQEIMSVSRQQVQNPETGEIATIKNPEIKVLFDGPDLEIIPFYDFFPDWQVKEPGAVQKMRGCVHRVYKTMSDLKKNKKYKNLDTLDMSVKMKGTEAWAAPYWSDQHKNRSEDLESDRGKVKDSDKIEVWEYWGLFDKTGKGDFEESIIVVANGDVLLRCDDNFYDLKFKPFIATPNYVRGNEFYGIPELACVDSEIKEATAIRNARLDQINLGLNTMWLVDRSGGIDTKNLYARPNGIIYTNDMNALKPISPSDPSVSSGQEIQGIEQTIAQATAVGAPPAGGSSKSFARSATGVNYLSSFGSSRLDLRIMLLGELCLKPLARIMLLTDRQFVTDQQIVRMKSPDAPNPFAELPPDAFYHSFDFILKTKQSLSDEQEFQKLQAASQVLQTAEATQPGSVKMDVAIEALLRPILGPGVAKFMRSPAEMQQLKMQNMAMRIQEQQANATIGQSAPQPNANPNSPGGPLTGGQ